MAQPHLQIVIGSIRPGHRGAAIGVWLHDLAVRHDRFDVELPLSDEPQPRWSARIGAGQAYVFVVPEHNHSYNAATKNALDHLKDEWRHKPIGLVGYGGGAAGGARAVRALTPVVLALGMRPVARSLHIPLINAALTDDGTLRTDERLDTGALSLLDDLYDNTEQTKGTQQNAVVDPSVRDRRRRTAHSA